MELADNVDELLTKKGWVVLRPDRTAGGIGWEEYLHWVAWQSQCGIPVLELHGQGVLPGMDHSVQARHNV